MLHRTSSTSSGKDDVSRQACQECAVALRDQLLFVVLPKEFLEEIAIRDAIINVWNCDPRDVCDLPGRYPSLLLRCSTREGPRTLCRGHADMNTTDTFTLAGIYRPRKHGPGSGIPVFLHDDQYWLQEISGEDHVKQFVTCDVEAQTLRPPPLPTGSTMHSVGQQALYAFEAADGTMKLGTRAEVSTWLQSRVSELQT